MPAIKAHDSKRRQQRREVHQALLPRLSPSDRHIVDSLVRDGVVVSDLNTLALPDTDVVQDILSALSQRLMSTASDGRTTLRPSNDELVADELLWRWGLNDRLLDIVENYLGVPVRYYGADVRREVADAKCVDVRQWHRDTEDERLFKILIWLNDVDEQTGPFQYVPRPSTQRITDALEYVTGYVTEERFTSVADPQEWRSATGSTWTTVIADTASVFHRAQPPVAHDRASVTFTYTTWHPVKLYQKVPFTAEQSNRIRRGLSDRQLTSLSTPLGA